MLGDSANVPQFFFIQDVFVGMHTNNFILNWVLSWRQSYVDLRGLIVVYEFIVNVFQDLAKRCFAGAQKNFSLLKLHMRRGVHVPGAGVGYEQIKNQETPYLPISREICRYEIQCLNRL